MKTAKLALEDGTVFEGGAFGAEGERTGEVVFNTALTGYPEILTDPSYRGQIVVMTYPHIGNYGVNEEDFESARPWVEGFVAREFSRVSSSHRARGTLEDFLRRHGIVGIDGIDTRALTLRLRAAGSMNGVVSTVDRDDRSLVEKARRVPRMEGLNLVPYVTGTEPKTAAEFVLCGPVEGKGPPRFRVGLLDFGVKYNIVRSLVRAGCEVRVFPATTPAGELADFDGICLSNGPGDPAAVEEGIRVARELLGMGKPLFGICLGHQILALALGARTYKLKFGHHGANHPVKELATGKVEITSQNHGFAVDEASLREAGAEVTHVNLNDGTVEGFRVRSGRAFSVQYHPEAAPGPRDSRYLFERFVAMMGGTL